MLTEDCPVGWSAIKRHVSRVAGLALSTALGICGASFAQVSPEETIGRFIYDLGNGQWDIPALRCLLEEVLPNEKSFRNFEVVHEFSSLGRRVMLLNGKKLWQDGNHTNGVLLAIEDVTGRKRAEDELVRSNEDLQRFAYVAAHDLRSPLNSGMRLLKMLAKRLKVTLST